MQQPTEDVFFKDLVQVLIHGIVLGRKVVENTAIKKAKFALGNYRVTRNEYQVIANLAEATWKMASNNNNNHSIVIEVIGDGIVLLERWTLNVKRAPFQSTLCLEQRCRMLQRATYSTLLMLPAGKQKINQHGYNIAVNYLNNASKLQFNNKATFTLFDGTVQRFCNFTVTFGVEYEKELPALKFLPPLRMIESAFLAKSFAKLPSPKLPVPQPVSQQEDDDPTLPPFARFGEPVPIEDYSEFTSDVVLPYADAYMHQLQNEQQDTEDVHENVVTRRIGFEYNDENLQTASWVLDSSSMSESEVRNMYKLISSWNFHLQNP